MNKAVIIILASLCVLLAGGLIFVVSKKEPEPCIKYIRPRIKRIKYPRHPAKSVSLNVDLVKEKKGYALYRYWQLDYDTVVIRGSRGGILYIGFDYEAESESEIVYYIAHKDYHGKSSKPVVGWISDDAYTEKPHSFTYMITNRKDNDMNTFDTTGIGFITPDEFWNNYKYLDWKSKLGRKEISFEDRLY